MNTKRILALLCAAMLLLSANACKVSVEFGGNKHTEETKADTETEAEPEETEEKNATEKAEASTKKKENEEKTTEADVDPNAPTNSHDGTVFPADYTTTGKVETNAPGITENAVIINGKKYTLPVPMQTFLNDGYYLKEVSEENNSIQPGRTVPIGLYLYFKTASGEEAKAFCPYHLKNDTDTNQKIEDCIVTQIEWTDSCKTTIVFPGGICNESTAADVLRIYGTPPDQNPVFRTGSVGKINLQYVKNKENGYGEIVFGFYEDGTLKSAKLEPDDRD